MAARSSKSKPRLPLKEIDEKNKKRIRELNGEFLNHSRYTFTMTNHARRVGGHSGLGPCLGFLNALTMACALCAPACFAADGP